MRESAANSYGGIGKISGPPLRQLYAVRWVCGTFHPFHDSVTPDCATPKIVSSERFRHNFTKTELSARILTTQIHKTRR